MIKEDNICVIKIVLLNVNSPVFAVKDTQILEDTVSLVRIKTNFILLKISYIVLLLVFQLKKTICNKKGLVLCIILF